MPNLCVLHKTSLGVIIVRSASDIGSMFGPFTGNVMFDFSEVKRLIC